MQNPFTAGRVPDVEMYPTLGAYQNRRKLVSAAWVPSQADRLLMKGLRRYWYAYEPATLAARETRLVRVTTRANFWLMIVLARASAAAVGGAGNFRLRIYEGDVPQNSYKFSDRPVNQLNLAPIASEPGFLPGKVPHYFPAGLPILASLQNLQTVNNTVNLALFGYSE